MAASLVTRKVCGATKAVLAQRTQSPRPISVVSCASQQEAVTPAKFFPQLMSSVMSAGVAASLLLGSVPTAYAAELRTLADVTRPNYGFVDANKDGWISKEEISQMAQQVAEEQEFDAPNDTLVDFSLRVFDLNQDGRLSTEEMLTGLALDGAVGEDVIDADIVKVFDKDGNGLTDLAEWKAPFGSLGPNGEQLKEFAFSRVDFLTDKDQKLDVSELANAVVLMRVMVLGY